MIIMEQPVIAQVEENSITSQPLSKKAQKRAVKAARLQEQKVERRAREKEAKKRKRRERAQAGDVVPRKRRKMDQTSFAAQVVIDLGFDDMMTDKVRTNIVGIIVLARAYLQEVTSLTSQLTYTYSANRRSSTPFTSLLFTSLNGRTKARLDAINDAGYKRWSNTEWWEEGYDRIWTSKSDSFGGNEDLDAHRTSVVYLTADSDEELMELKEGEIYVIGGICDHNRYKVCTFEDSYPVRYYRTQEPPRAWVDTFKKNQKMKPLSLFSDPMFAFSVLLLKFPVKIFLHPDLTNIY